jgi:hypothetical protein
MRHGGRLVRRADRLSPRPSRRRSSRQVPPPARVLLRLSVALLPVDSNHRGRLQLAVARAGGMGDDRACVMLRYAMVDVLQSGLSLRRRGDLLARGGGGRGYASPGGATASSPRENDDDAPGPEQPR